MATHPLPSAKNATGEYAAFENALKQVLSVPHPNFAVMVFEAASAGVETAAPAALSSAAPLQSGRAAS